MKQRIKCFFKGHDWFRQYSNSPIITHYTCINCAKDKPAKGIKGE